MVFNPPVVDLLFAFLFLVPGFISYRLARHFGKITVQSDSFNKTAYSLVFSGIAISITWVLASTISDVAFTAIINDALSPLQWAVVYLGVIGVSAGQGIVLGLVVDRGLRRNHQDSRRRVWTMAFNGAEQPIEARIVTKNGDRLHGFVQSWDSVGHGRDVLLRYPRKLKEDLEEVGENDGVFIGEYLLIDETDISQIFFEGDVDVEGSRPGLVARATDWIQSKRSDSTDD